MNILQMTISWHFSESSGADWREAEAAGEKEREQAELRLRYVIP